MINSSSRIQLGNFMGMVLMAVPITLHDKFLQRGFTLRPFSSLYALYILNDSVIRSRNCSVHCISMRPVERHDCGSRSSLNTAAWLPPGILGPWGLSPPDGASKLAYLLEPHILPKEIHSQDI